MRLDVAGFVGVALRGPVDEPVPVDALVGLRALFGGFERPAGGARRLLPYAVRAFFAQGGQRRVRAAGWRRHRRRDGAPPGAGRAARPASPPPTTRCAATCVRLRDEGARGDGRWSTGCEVAAGPDVGRAPPVGRPQPSRRGTAACARPAPCCGCAAAGLPDRAVPALGGWPSTTAGGPRRRRGVLVELDAPPVRRRPVGTAPSAWTWSPAPCDVDDAPTAQPRRETSRRSRPPTRPPALPRPTMLDPRSAGWSAAPVRARGAWASLPHPRHRRSHRCEAERIADGADRCGPVDRAQLLRPRRRRRAVLDADPPGRRRPAPSGVDADRAGARARPAVRARPDLGWRSTQVPAGEPSAAGPRRPRARAGRAGQQATASPTRCRGVSPRLDARAPTTWPRSSPGSSGSWRLAERAAALRGAARRPGRASRAAGDRTLALAVRLQLRGGVPPVARRRRRRRRRPTAVAVACRRRPSPPASSPTRERRLGLPWGPANELARDAVRAATSSPTPMHDRAARPGRQRLPGRAGRLPADRGDAPCQRPAYRQLSVRRLMTMLRLTPRRADPVAGLRAATPPSCATSSPGALTDFLRDSGAPGRLRRGDRGGVVLRPLRRRRSTRGSSSALGGCRRGRGRPGRAAGVPRAADRPGRRRQPVGEWRAMS